MYRITFVSLAPNHEIVASWTYFWRGSNYIENGTLYQILILSAAIIFRHTVLISLFFFNLSDQIEYILSS
jgi:hypothetical protein